MMLGYVHNTSKIWRIWDFNSGRTARAVECSSVVFEEEENAHTEEQTEVVEFPENADELHEEMHESQEKRLSRQEKSPSGQEKSPSRQEKSPSRQENSKSNHFIVDTANWLRAAGRYEYIPVTVIRLSEVPGQKTVDTPLLGSMKLRDGTSADSSRECNASELRRELA
jgi:hypothetical protein